MEDLSSYIPTDRLHAMANGQPLPDRADGSALFSDISGFTPLTEALVKELGPQRGPEEIARYINAVFDSLITFVNLYHGSVVIFSGDAITCWFDGDNGLRAAACALAMQNAMQQFAHILTPSGQPVSLAMKVAIATGQVRRFVVGDPQFQVHDVLAGSTLDRLAEVEHHAKRGEIVLDAKTVETLQGLVEFSDWKVNEDTGEQYGVAARLKTLVSPNPWPALPRGVLKDEQLRPWLLPPVYARLQSDQGEFLAEIRPALPMFVYFTGIDYDNDIQAAEKLNTFICRVEGILAKYEGSLLSIVMGDKGSYLYAVFGAPVAHEDDAFRAATTALEIRALEDAHDFITDIRIGMTQGWLFVGASGSSTWRTYVAMGDEVNLAARLMQAAAPRQILVTSRIEQSIAVISSGENLPPIKVKGKSELIPIYNLQGLRSKESIHLQQLKYAFPMVGREAELKQIDALLDKVSNGKGQIIGITGDAGVGKSRLVAEVIRLAQEHNLVLYGGECQAYGINTNYLVWRSIWNALFGLDPHASLDTHTYNVRRQLMQIDPVLEARMPLLGPVLNLPLPENDLTRGLDTKVRKNSLEALLVDVLRAKSSSSPLVLILEDCHWLDDLSHDLLGALGRAAANLPVLILLSYRPPQLDRLKHLVVSPMPHFTEITLGDFTPQESARLIHLKLEQMTGSQGSVPQDLVKRITERSEGNPFYIEELLNYLKDRHLDPRDASVIDKIELPNSLYSLILSRIDQISESQKATLKVASVIGRMFRAAWVWGYYPTLGQSDQILSSLQSLEEVDLTPRVREEAEQTYLFKHIMTQEVAYDSLPYNTRLRLHGLFGRFLEENYAGRLDRYIDLLAFHYDNSDQQEKRREYLMRAGEYSQAHYANLAAIDYYRRLLPIATMEEKITASIKLGQVLELVGKWNEAGEIYHQALNLAGELGDHRFEAHAETSLGELYRKQSRYAEAAEWLEKARQVFEDLMDGIGIGQVLHFSGTVAAHQGNYAHARELYEKSLEIRRALNDRSNIASLLSNLGIVARFQGETDQARSLHEQALVIRRELGDRWAIGVSLNNLGNVAIDQGRFSEARALLEEGLAMRREVGDPWSIANALNNLGNLARAQGDTPAARELYVDSLKINQQLDGKLSIAYLLEDIGCLETLCGRPERAFRLIGAASALRKLIGSPLSPAESKKIEGFLEPVRRQVAGWAAIAAEGEQMQMDQAVELALSS